MDYANMFVSYEQRNQGGLMTSWAMHMKIIAIVTVAALAHSFMIDFFPLSFAYMSCLADLVVGSFLSLFYYFMMYCYHLL